MCLRASWNNLVFTCQMMFATFLPLANSIVHTMYDLLALHFCPWLTFMLCICCNIDLQTHHNALVHRGCTWLWKSYTVIFKATLCHRATLCNWYNICFNDFHNLVKTFQPYLLFQPPGGTENKRGSLQRISFQSSIWNN